MQYEVILALIVGCMLGFYYLKTRQNTPRHLKQRAVDLDELLKMKTKESNKWKGRYNSRNAGPVVAENDGKEADLETVIPQLARDYVKNAPTWLKPILQNEATMKWVVQLAKDHPDEAKQFLGKFIGKKIPGGTVQEEVSGL